ncbi:MAG: hypothetical protein ABI586_06110 [Candidatus Nanopelagicales bacterium]
MKRVVILLAAAAFLASVLAPAQAVAEPPFNAHIKGVLRSTCDFPVSFRLEGKLSFKTFRQDSGHFASKIIETSPGWKGTFTNLNSGTTFRYTIAGPAIYKKVRGGSGSSAFLGPWVWTFNPVTGDDGIWISKGRWYQSTTENRFSGRLIDVCQALTEWQGS